MGSGDDEGERWSERDHGLGTDASPEDMSARASAAARAFAALGLSNPARPVPPPAEDALTGPTGSTGPPSATVPRVGVSSEPLRPDAVLRGRRFTPPDAERDHEARTERRRAFDERRQVHAPPEEADVPQPEETPPTLAPAPAAAGSARPEARRRDRALLHLLALAVACGALVAPVVWPAVVALAALIGATARSVADHGPAAGALLHRAARRGASWLRLGSVLWLPVLVARTVLLAIALPALLWAAHWLVVEGSHGLVAAARTGIWTDGFRAASAVVCFMLVSGVGDARHRRAAQMRRAFDARGPVAPVALVGAALSVTFLAVAVVPRMPAGGVTGTDGLAWVPGPLHGTIDGFRDDIAVAEIQSAAECLSDHQGLRWRPGYTRDNASGDDDVARLTTRDDPTDADLATAGVALHDLLAPWVDMIVIESGRAAVLVVDRREVDGARPLTDASALAGAATVGRGAIERGAAGADRGAALDCASPPVP